MQSSKGMSGAPIIQKVGDEFFIRGIHLKDIDPVIQRAKMALKLNMDVFRVLNQLFK